MTNERVRKYPLIFLSSGEEIESVLGDMKKEESSIDSTHLSISVPLGLRITSRGLCSPGIFACQNGLSGNGSYG